MIEASKAPQRIKNTYGSFSNAVYHNARYVWCIVHCILLYRVLRYHSQWMAPHIEHVCCHIAQLIMVSEGYLWTKDAQHVFVSRNFIICIHMQMIIISYSFIVSFHAARLKEILWLVADYNNLFFFISDTFNRAVLGILFHETVQFDIGL